MAKTIEQIFAIFVAGVARSEMGMAVAKQNGNYYLAALNCGQALKCWLMQGLIAWRSGNNPTSYLEQAVSRFAADWRTVQEIGGESAKLSDAGYEQVYFVAYLIDRPLPFSVQSDA